MQFKFDADQKHQLDAVESVARLLDGQSHIELQLDVLSGNGALANRLDLTDADLLTNLHTVQIGNGLKQDSELARLSSEQSDFSFPNFTVEMETGTGKTYVYIRTILELYRRYGLRKFIIVVPSVAIREGVLKTLQITRAHFAALYENLPYRFYVYDSSNLAQIRQFALSDSAEIMVITLDSFNKTGELNVIRQTPDQLGGEMPLSFIQASRPVLVLDEPQNMESENSKRALADLHPLFTLRYSATHRESYNRIYRLTPADAYQLGLVKRVEVAGAEQEDANRPYIDLKSVETQKRTVTAKLVVHTLKRNGTVTEKTITVKRGDDLSEKTDRPEYAGYVVDEIDINAGIVYFANDISVKRDEVHGADRQAIFNAQIRYTIEQHFRRQRSLQGKGIKVLSLFFIDRVANYQDEDGNPGIIRQLFDSAFNDLKKRYPEWMNLEADTVQAAYFARKRKKDSADVLEDSTTGTAQKDAEAYDLIMRDKERLLSFNETPVAFIFSHSALREGWDNPNVFQICTLNQSVSDIRKRQEIGRGVRLPVNQIGERIRDEGINILTVVANESYERYVADYQQELAESFGTGELPPKPRDARHRQPAKLRKKYTLNEDFKALWQKISRKTRYHVRIDTNLVLADILAELNNPNLTPLPAANVTIRKGALEVTTSGQFEAYETQRREYELALFNAAPPDLIGMMRHLLDFAGTPIRISDKTLVSILAGTTRLAEARRNPQGFAAAVVRILRTKLSDLLVNGIQYIPINEYYEMSQFQEVVEPFLEHVVPVLSSEKTLYDHIECDSHVEKEFVEGLERREDVLFYVKLPSWFTVPTPVGDYNPDWAIVMIDEAKLEQPKLYLVRETKSTLNRDELRPDERRKIDCGEKHFRDALGVDFRVVTAVTELP